MRRGDDAADAGISRSIKPDLTEEALLATGLCQIKLGNPAAGDVAFTQLLGQQGSRAAA